MWCICRTTATSRICRATAKWVNLSEQHVGLLKIIFNCSGASGRELLTELELHSYTLQTITFGKVQVKIICKSVTLYHISYVEDTLFVPVKN